MKSRDSRQSRETWQACNSPHVRESKTVLDSGFLDADSGSGFRNLDSCFQSLVGFWIPWAVFRIPKPGILDSTSTIFPDFEFYKQKFPGLIQNLGSIAWGKAMLLKVQWNQPRAQGPLLSAPSLSRSVGRVGKNSGNEVPVKPLLSGHFGTFQSVRLI